MQYPKSSIGKAGMAGLQLILRAFERIRDLDWLRMGKDMRVPPDKGEDEGKGDDEARRPYRQMPCREEH